MPGSGHGPTLAINIKNGDAIVAAVGDVDIFTGRMDMDISNPTLLRPAFVIATRQRGQGIDLLQSPTRGVELKSDDRRVQLIAHIDKALVRMKVEMPRAGARLGARPRLRRVRLQFAMFYVKGIDHHF